MISMNNKLYYLLMMLLLNLPANAQKEMQWENVTTLHYAATNGTDKENVLQQYLLFDEAELNKHEDLIPQVTTFSEEFKKNYLNQAVPEGLKQIDQAIADFKKKMKDFPDMADELKESIKQMEAAKKQFAEEYGAEATDYTYDPTVLLQNLTKIAVNKKAYSAYKDIDGGLFAVKTGPTYGPLGSDAFDLMKKDEKYEYTWGAIDYNGRYVIEPKYGEFNVNKPDDDIIFLQTKDKSGAVRAGACGYDGRVRIPFIYDYRADVGFGNNICVMSKDGKFGIVNFDGKVVQPFEFTKPEYFAYGWAVSKDGKNYGVIDYQAGKLVIPLKYKCFWSCVDDGFQMQRHDGKLDVYDETFKLIRTEEPKE